MLGFGCGLYSVPSSTRTGRDGVNPSSRHWCNTIAVRFDRFFDYGFFLCWPGLPCDLLCLDGCLCGCGGLGCVIVAGVGLSLGGTDEVVAGVGSSFVVGSGVVAAIGSSSEVGCGVVAAV